MTPRKKRRKQQKKAVANRRQRQPRDCPFYDFLEDLGIVCDGVFDSVLIRVINSGRSRRIALAHFIDAQVQETRCTDTVEYWGALEIIVPRDKLFFECLSETYADQEQPSSRYHFWSVTWRQGRKLHAGTKLVTGECSSWRRYKCKRMETATYEPWIYFDITLFDNEVSLEWNPDALAEYLCMAATQQATEAFPDKLTRKIIGFAYKSDPDAFDDAVEQALDRHPDLRSSLHHLLPAKYSLPERPSHKTWFTVDELAKDLDLSAATIRRVIRQLTMKPLSRRRPWLYTHQQLSAIKDTLSKNEARKQS